MIKKEKLNTIFLVQLGIYLFRILRRQHFHGYPMNTIALDTEKQITINYASFALAVKDLFLLRAMQ